MRGGSVRVESAVNQGSCFHVSIPLGAAHLPPDRIETVRTLASTSVRSTAYVSEALGWLPEAISPATADSQPVLAGALDRFSTPNPAYILLADDNADMRTYVRRLLVQQGYAVEAVADGQATLQAAHERVPDLVLSDVMMPPLDGFGLLRALRAEEHLATVPVILLSARAGEEAQVEGWQTVRMII